MAQTNLAFAHHEADPQRSMQIVALNGLFDDMDAAGVLRHAVADVLPGQIAVVSSFGPSHAIAMFMRSAG